MRDYFHSWQDNPNKIKNHLEGDFLFSLKFIINKLNEKMREMNLKSTRE